MKAFFAYNENDLLIFWYEKLIQTFPDDNFFYIFVCKNAELKVLSGNVKTAFDRDQVARYKYRNSHFYVKNR